jgi:hypothetical protein
MKDSHRVAATASLVRIAAAFIACGKGGQGDILLFTGTGTSRGDVEAVKTIFRRGIAFGTPLPRTMRMRER